MQILVVGMHRAGTSAVTRCLNLMGAYFGPEGIETGANIENPKGFWERRDIRRINDQVLQGSGHEWDRVVGFDVATIPSERRIELLDTAKRIILGMDGHRPWVLKEPRFCLTLGFWRELLEVPVVVLVHRHPTEVAKSLKERNGFPLSFGVALWEHYVHAALRGSQGLPRALVFHRQLMTDPLKAVARLHSDLTGYGVEGLRIPSEQAIRAFIDPGLYRQRCDSIEEQAILNTAQRQLLSSLDDGSAITSECSVSPSPFSLDIMTSVIDARDAWNARKEGEQQLEAANKALTRARDDLERQNRWLEASKAKRIEMEKANDLLRQKIATLEKSVSDQRIELETVNQQQEVFRKAKIEWESQKAVLKLRSDELREEKSELEDKLRVQVINLATHTHRFWKLMDTFSEQKKVMKREIEDLQRSLSNERQTHAEALTEIAREQARALDAVEETSARLERAKERENRLEEALNRLREENESLCRNVDEMRHSLSAMSSLNREKEQALTRTMAELSLARAELDHIKHSMMWKVGYAVYRVRRALRLRPAPDAEVLEGEAEKVSSARERSIEFVEEQRKQNCPADRKLRISVIGWDLCHNPLGRSYLLADLLRESYEVDLIGARFPRYGNQLWEPIRGCHRVDIKSFRGMNFPDHFFAMNEVAKQISGDILLVSKPRLPALELAILAKMDRDRPIILDIDDLELAFFKNSDPLTLDDIRAQGLEGDLLSPHDEMWTRYCENLIPFVDGILVSNEELQKRYGGLVLPHVRDEGLFDPEKYDRTSIRAELGYSEQDRVVLFVGTPRMHKGFADIVKALDALNHDHYKLLIVGSPVDADAKAFLDSVDCRRIQVVGNTSFSELPRWLSVGDLICVLQDPDREISRFQMPAKVTDGLAMAVPILGSNVPPLLNLHRRGLINLVNDTPLAERIDHIFQHYETFKAEALKNRAVFLEEFSYGANAPNLDSLIKSKLNHFAPLPQEFERLVEYHRHSFSKSRSASESMQGDRLMVHPAEGTQTEALGVHTKDTRDATSVSARDFVDEKLDVVFFWKQNDTGIYGRRQDMILKYMAKDPRIHKILHFDEPMDAGVWWHSLDWGSRRRFHQSNLVFIKTLRRVLGMERQGKIRLFTFLYACSETQLPGIVKRRFPPFSNYVKFLTRVFEKEGIGKRRTVFWVCPKNFHFPNIAREFNPDLIVADVIDDHRKWPVKSKYRQRLDENYREILGLSDLAFANCQNVRDSMSAFIDNIHLVPNGAEFLETKGRAWRKPRALRRLKGPVIGYVGNLDAVRIDLDLLHYVAKGRPDLNLVFIGSMHRSQDLMDLDVFPNVVFLGVKPYERALRYIRHFDVAIIPHLDNELTQQMNPLKLYVYFALNVPIVSTPVANLDEIRTFVRIGSDGESFVRAIDESLKEAIGEEEREQRQRLLTSNTWSCRVKEILDLVDQAFIRKERDTRS